ncbi:AT-hook motif nuclear-localized protein 1-like [Andrographis paniculata]|uniref:AT-hook motif nuclear-localized protein 1-like n=1 Tax=Andrographis paniculata TaxID=175694 RepID=UPI0021E845D6|nr:AT-hook motif nuclear-localized protein 1-like [Andrographis paniculata]
MEGSSSGAVTVVSSDAPSAFHVAPRPPSEKPTAVAAAAPAAGKKKRGRPRKYDQDGSLAMALSLSPRVISSSSAAATPPVIDFSAAAAKRGKVRPVAAVAKIQVLKTETATAESSGEWGSCSVGANFTPHIITVNSGEDVTMKVISFSQQGPRAICILSANGVVSSVTLRQPDSSGGTLTYEGRFEILSLSGSFMPSETGGMRNRSGGMSVSLASPDGRVVGGGVAGSLVASSPVQIVVGSFLASGTQIDPIKPKKPKPELPPTSIIPIGGGAVVPVSSVGPAAPLFRGDSWSSMPTPDPSGKPVGVNVGDA